jgi:hypothetical protein
LLSPEEVALRCELKFKCLGLASLAQTITPQQSRLTFLHEGNVNTKFFHLQVCHRGQKNFIDHLLHMGATVVDEAEKAQLLFGNFDAILSMQQERSVCLTFTRLNLPTLQLSSLDKCFS